MANTSGINETIKCPNGFYFGDPCYALKEDLYNTLQQPDRIGIGTFFSICADYGITLKS